MLSDSRLTLQHLPCRRALQRPSSRLRRLLSLTNIIWFLGSLLVAVALLSLGGIYLLALLTLVPVEAWEAMVRLRVLRQRREAQRV